MRVLDLFCGGGGASAGYAAAGFDVTGIDVEWHPEYPCGFLLGDVLKLDPEFLREFDLIHASPPCQAYSPTYALRDNKQRDSKTPPPVDLLGATRALLQASGKPWVIENVTQAPLVNPTVLCGQYFNLGMYRHRGFETSGWYLQQPKHQAHIYLCSRNGYLPTPERPYMTITGRNGHHSKAWVARAAACMGTPWLAEDLNGVCEAIPPAYTEYVGRSYLYVGSES